jgi:succinoglycan biosynthesis transport protein ExoP
MSSLSHNPNAIVLRNAGPLPVKPSMISIEPGLGKSGSSVAALLRRHRFIIAGIILLSALLGGLVALLSTPLYRATTVLEVQSVNPEFLKMKELDPTSASQSPESHTATEAKLIQSESLSKRVVEVSRLNQRPEFFKRSAAYEELRAMFGGKRANGSEPSIRETAELLRSRIKEKVDGDSNLLVVTVDAPEPNLAGELAQTLAREFELKEQEDRWNSSARVSGWLTGQLEDLRQKMEHSSSGLQQFVNSTGLVYGKDGSSVAEDKLRQIQEELSHAQADRVVKQAQMNQAASSPAGGQPLILDDAPIREYKLKLAELQRTLADLSTTLTPEHYKVESVQAQIAETNSALEQQRLNVIERIKNEYLMSAARETMLTRSYASQTNAVAGEASRSARYGTLKKQAESDEELYRSMLEKVKETSMLGAIRTNSVQIVDPAQPPDQKFSPSYATNIGLGMLGGIILSALFVVVRERLDIAIREPGEMSSALNIRELGAIPSLGKDRPARSLPFGAKSKSNALDRVKPTNGIGDRSLISEAFRCTAASLLFAENGAALSKVFLMTSAYAGVGKTTTAVNLAIALGAGNRRVALIEGDLRKPMLHQMFGLPNSSGLADLLQSEAPLDYSAVQTRLRPTGMKNLFLMTAGAYHMSHPSSLQSGRLTGILSQLRQDYDIVIVDCPPALQLPDARLLARDCDAVVLIGRAGQSKIKDLAQVAHIFNEDGRRIAGTILTDWDPRHEHPGYFASYYRRYA